MFNKLEIKEIVLKKWIFPDFSNRLTWFIAGLGAMPILMPPLLKQLFYNFIVDVFGLNSGQNYTLAELQLNSSDYWFGFSVIFLALLHNVSCRILSYKSDKQEKNDQKELIEVDKKLFLEFIDLLPSDGLDVKLLENHDFGCSHSENEIKSLNRFVETWDNAQKEFLDEELEYNRLVFITKSRHFVYTLASRSYSIGSGSLFSCIPDLYRRSYDDWPVHVNEQI